MLKVKDIHLTLTLKGSDLWTNLGTCKFLLNLLQPNFLRASLPNRVSWKQFMCFTAFVSCACVLGQGNSEGLSPETQEQDVCFSYFLNHWTVSELAEVVQVKDTVSQKSLVCYPVRSSLLQRFGKIALRVIFCPTYHVSWWPSNYTMAVSCYTTILPYHLSVCLLHMALGFIWQCTKGCLIEV